MENITINNRGENLIIKNSYTEIIIDLHLKKNKDIIQKFIYRLILEQDFECSMKGYILTLSKEEILKLNIYLHENEGETSIDMTIPLTKKNKNQLINALKEMAIDLEESEINLAKYKKREEIRNYFEPRK